VWGCQPHAQPLTWRTRVSLFVWPLPLDLSGLGGPTSSYATAGIALMVSWALKPHHHDKVGLASVGKFQMYRPKIGIPRCISASSGVNFTQKFFRFLSHSKQDQGQKSDWANIVCFHIITDLSYSHSTWRVAQHKQLWTTKPSSGMLRSATLVRTDVSEESSVSIIRVTKLGELGRTVAATSNRCTLRRNTMCARAPLRG
jgi:hypothetical protein